MHDRDVLLGNVPEQARRNRAWCEGEGVEVGCSLRIPLEAGRERISGETGVDRWADVRVGVRVCRIFFSFSF